MPKEQPKKWQKEKKKKSIFHYTVKYVQHICVVIILFYLQAIQLFSTNSTLFIHFLKILWLHLQHMEVPEPGTESETQL